MADLQVMCINKENHQSRHEDITHLGSGTGTNRVRWTRQQVITSIEGGTNTFYTFEGGKRADGAVIDGPNGKYVRTHADGKLNDNLLALAECIV